MRKSGRLLFICSSLGVGGFERHLAQLTQGLQELGYEPNVLVLRRTGRIFDEMIEHGIKMTFAGLGGRADVRAMHRAAVRVRGWPQVVLTESIDAHVLGATIARREDVPHVTLEHGGGERLEGLRRHHRLAYRLIGPRVSRAVSVSARQVPAMLDIGYRADRVAVILNGVPEPVSSGDRSELRARLGLDFESFVVSLVATLRPEKRADQFVTAVAAAHKEESSIRGIVIGGGSELNRVAGAARATGGVVKAVGDRDDVGDWMFASDLVALSSVAECLPLAILEAMALRKPVVVTDVGGLRELVRPGETGLLVPPDAPREFADAIVALARDPARAAAMGRAGYERFRNEFTLARMVGDYDRLLSGLLEGARPMRP